MLCGIHYFTTELKTKIDVIILNRFNPHPTKCFVLCFDFVKFTILYVTVRLLLQNNCCGPRV